VIPKTPVPHQLNAFLNSNQDLRQLAQRVKQIAALQQLYQLVAPPILLQASRVVHLRGSTLFITADNGAVAAKLRQISPELISLFLTRGCEVTGIQIRVQVRNQIVPVIHKKRNLGKIGQKALEELAVKMADSPLKATLIRLAKRNS